MPFFLLLYLVPQIVFLQDAPPYYPTLLSALEAGRANQKEVVIFFSKRSCPECPMAWKTFETDPGAMSAYISTRMDVEDFDGSLVFRKYEPGDAPAWVILSPDGQVKDQWSGGWKDASGNPVPLPSVANPSGKESPLTKTGEPSSSAAPKAAAAMSVISVSEIASAPPMTQHARPSSVPGQTQSAEGFVLQAGYFGSAANAEKLVSNLSAKGFAGYTTKTTIQNGSTFYRVISGVFSSESEAGDALQRLKQAGITANLKKSAELQ